MQDVWGVSRLMCVVTVVEWTPAKAIPVAAE